MDCRQFIVALTGHLAWPVTVFTLLLIFHSPIAKLIKRMVSIKHGDFELNFAERTKRLIEGKIDRDKYFKKQILHETPHYKLYANGMLVQKIQLKLAAGLTSREVTFPTTFPGEAVSIQAIGDIDLVVRRLAAGNCTITFNEVAQDREITLLVSGV